MATSKFLLDEKIHIIQMYDNGTYTLKEIASLFELSLDTLNTWRRRYRHGGALALSNRTGWTRYSEELKTQAVRAVLDLEESLRSATLRFGISSKSVLQRWISQYTGHSTQGKPLKERFTMTKARKTTFEERVEAVMDCIQNGKDYQHTMKTHRVSYQQIYSWVRKFEKDGIDALLDRRGRRKAEEELTAGERFMIEMKQLEKENERLRMENAFLKKLEEIERRSR